MISNDVVNRLINEATKIGIEVYVAQDSYHLKASLLELLFKRYAPYSSLCLPLDVFSSTGELINTLKNRNWKVLLADNSISYEEFLVKLRYVHIGITPVDLCIAETSTLVIRNNRPFLREISLFPPVHIAVTRTDQIILKLEEAGKIIDKWLMESVGVTFITGPSKTADIELNLVRGVHGPKELILFILSQY